MSNIVSLPCSLILIEAAIWPLRYLVTYRDQHGTEFVFWDGTSFSEATKEANDLRADFGVKSPIVDRTVWCHQ